MAIVSSCIYLILLALVLRHDSTAAQGDVTYSVAVSNLCHRADSAVYLHVMTTSGNVSSCSSNVPSTGEWIPSSQPTYILNQGVGENEVICLQFTKDAQTSMSVWRMWWDSFETSQGSINQTLVEVTCLAQTSAVPAQECFVDVSLVDAFTSTVTINFTGTESLSSLQSPIVAKPSAGWECPMHNRMWSQFHSKPPSTVFLPHSQACLSNCTLLQTDESCCRAAFTNTCPNSDPSFQAGIAQAFSYALDNSKVRQVSVPTGATAMAITICS